MIIGIGTDIVGVARIRFSLERFGDRFAKRVLSEQEFSEFRGAANRDAFLAKRFAAKEAAAKAFGTGFADGLALRHIEVTHDPRGRPELRFTGRAAQIATELDVTRALLSISDEREHALAFVVLEKD